VAGGHCKVAWRTVCSPLVNGGLGILDLRFFGFDLRLHAMGMVTADWIRERLGVASFTVGEVHQCDAQCLNSSLSVIIGDGRSARFWTDVWLPNGSLASLAPCLVKAISRAGNMHTVAETLNNRAWVRDIVGALTTQVLCDYIRVWELVQDIVLQPLEPDRFVWKWTPNGSYSASSTYRAFFNGSCELLGAVELWKTLAPPKVKFFFLARCPW